MTGSRDDLKGWLRAYRDLGAEFLDLPEQDGPDSPERKNGLCEAAEKPTAAPAPPPASAARDPLRGVFPCQTAVMENADLSVLEEVPAGGDGLEQVRAALGECTRCRLHEGRTNLVFGVGNPSAEVMFIGEGPGRDEDLKGEPFVGRAGNKLNEMIRSIGMRREDVYIANVVKCRPPQNRTPARDEADTCSPFLHAQIAAIRPRVLITLGLPASQALLGSCTSMKSVRGRFHEYRGVPVMPTYHPAYLLRSPGENRKVAHDLALVMRHLGKELPAWAAKALLDGAP